MDIPFKVVFIQNGKDPITTIKFVTSEQDLLKMKDEEIPTAIENIDLEIIFESNNREDKLYFDLLDIVPSIYLESDELNISYITPSEYPIDIFKNDSKDYNYGSLIPGYYKITINHNNQHFYSWLKIEPKQITEVQWNALKDEVEATLQGLARDIIYKRTGTKLDSNSLLPLNLITKLEFVNKYYNNWKISLEKVRNAPRYQISKKYNLMNKSKVKIMDNTSLRYLASGKSQNSLVYAPKNVINYDILENKWLRYMIQVTYIQSKSLNLDLDSFIEGIKQEIQVKKKYKNSLEKDLRYHRLVDVISELNQYRSQLIRIKTDCYELMQMEWFIEIENVHPRTNSIALQMDSNYRTIYKFYKSLITESYSIEWNNEYTYFWKRTDQLYEIWGYIQFIQGLLSDEVGFVSSKGWLFEEQLRTNNNFVIPFLKQGTTVEFYKDDVVIKLVYDESISYSQKQSKSSLLYTNMKSNRPDTRMDFYKGGEYIGSIIIDFKYRPLFRIWDRTRLNPKRQTDVMVQLISYRDSIKSIHLYNKSHPNQWHRYRAVHEVWAVYPNHSRNLEGEDPFASHQIRLVELTPLVGKERFCLDLKAAIDRVVKAAEF